MEPGPRLDIRLLGDLTVLVDGTVVPIVGRQQQALLTLLSFRANATIPHERLVDALWGLTPPSTAGASLRVSVSKLRRALDDGAPTSVVVTQPGGYLLRVERHETDLGRFQALVADAGTVTDPETRGARLSQALALWRGPPMPGVDYDAVANGELTRLLELHDLATEDRIDCGLELGRDRELLPELTALVADHPLRERPHAQLMRALSRSGRAPEALDVYQSFRTRLVDELGLEPSAELRALQRSILDQDEPPPAATRLEATPDPPRRRRRKSGAALVSGVALVGLVAAATAVALSSGRGSSVERPPAEQGSVARLDAETGAVLGQLPVQSRTRVGDGFGTVVVAGDTWVLNSIDHSISRVDETTGTVRATIETAGDPIQLAASSGDLWVTSAAQNHVSRIDGQTDQVETVIPVGRMPEGIVEADGDIWVANHRGRPSGSVWRIDPETSQVLERILVGARDFRGGPQWLAAGAGAVWVGVPNLSAVVRIDPERNVIVATIPVADGGVCGQLIADDEAVWVGSGFCGDGNLTRIDPSTNEVVATIKSPQWTTVFGGAIGFGSVWITTDAGPFEIDPATNEVVSRLALEGDTVFGGDLAVGAGSLWIHDAQDQRLLRIDPTAP